MTEENRTDNEMPEEELAQPAAEEQEQEIAADGQAAEDAAPEEPDSSVEIETLKQELEETRSQMLRIAAEADNFKKRMEREKEKLVKYAGENILRDLLTTVDNLDRALEQGGVEGGDPMQKLEAMLAGVDLTRKGLQTMLERFEVTPLDSVGVVAAWSR